ncbi:MAG: hypothetical protein R3C10_01595 [Pirellulales bacterium]
MARTRGDCDRRHAGAAALAIGLFGSFLVPHVTLADGDWTSWRGGVQQGTLDVGNGPVHWKADENVRWETAIPGSGHSSPILYNDRVYVTTSYVTPSARTQTLVLAFVGVGLASAIAGWSIWVIATSGTAARESGHRFLPLAGIVAFALAAVFLTFFVLFGPAALNYGRCIIRGWLGSAIAVSMCIALAEFRAPPGQRMRLFMGCAAVAFGLLIIAAVPAKGHAYRGGLFAAQTTIVLFVGAVPIFLGIASMLNYWAASRDSANAMRRARFAHLVPATTFALYTVYAAAVIPKEALRPVVIVVVCIAAVTAACMYYAAAMSGHVVALRHATATTERAPSPAIGRAVLILAVVALILISGVLLFTHVVRNSAFLSLQLANPQWRPEFGWMGVALFVVAALFGYPLGQFVSHRAPRVGRVVVGCGLATFGGVIFLNTNFIAPRRVFTRAIVCLDDDDGAVEWTCQALAGRENQLHKYNSPATPTPVIHRDRVIAYFGAHGRALLRSRRGTALGKSRCDV